MDSLQTVITVNNSTAATVTRCNSTAAIPIRATVTTVNGATYTGATSWETLGSGNFDDENNLITNYNPSAADLSMGAVRLVLHPACNCPQATDTVKIIFLPPINLGTISTQSATTCGVCDGKLFLPIQNGNSPFTITYLRVGGASTTVTLARNTGTGLVEIPSLCAGAYQITAINDANNCPAVSGLNNNAVIDKPISPILGTGGVVANASTSCRTCNGSVAVELASGTPPFSINYTSTTGTQTLNGQVLDANNRLILPNFCKDTLRNIRITDANNCVLPNLSGPFYINLPELPLIGSNGVTTQDASSCAACDGKILLQISATQPGTTPYTVLFDSLGITKTRRDLVLNANNKVVITGLCPNSYTNIRLSDSLGCGLVSPVSLAGPYLIGQPNAPKIDTAYSINQCGSPSVIKVLLNSVHLGLSPYRVTVGNGTTATIFNNVFIAGNVITLNNIVGGNYDYIELIDSRGCRVVYNRPLFLWRTLRVELAASGCQPNGIMTATAEGVGTLSYAWSLGNQNSTSISGLNSAIYTVTVTDNTTFCTVSSSLILKPCKSTIQTTVRLRDTVEICLPQGDLAQPITSFSVCGQPSSGQVLLDGLNPCFQYVSTNSFMGNTQFCVVQCNAQGLCDTTAVLVTIYYNIPGTNTLLDTVGINATKSYCPPSNQLPGTISSVTQIYTNQLPNITFQTVGNCLFYTGNTIGSDTAQFVLCDNQGFCDTTILYITTFPRPNALDDSNIVQSNTTSVLNITGNDNLYTNEAHVTLLNGTSDGEVIVTIDNKLSFVAYPGVCNRSITPLRYRVCTAAGCDTATVFIYVNCVIQEELAIYNAVSPNNDGLNEVFMVKGIQKYPNNLLQIFNRWGALVYEKKGYNNDWDGTWNGYDLPNGTYFYVLDLGDNTKKYTGYLQLQR